MDPAFAARYSEWARDHWWFRGRRRILETVLRRESLPPRSRILSVGAGPVEGNAWLSSFGEVIASDVDPVFAPGYRQRHAPLVRASEALPFANAAFDAVAALDVIEHLDDDAGALREMARVLKPGGLLLVTVPAMPSLWSSHDVINHHRRRYTRATLREAFSRAGLGGVRPAYFNSILLPPIAAARWSRRILGVERKTSDFETGPGPVLSSLLAGVMGAERHLLGRLPFPRGASLFALARGS